MRKSILFLLVASLLLLLAVPAFAAGSCGETLEWSYADGVLTITGLGEMFDFDSAAPWADYKNEIKQVVMDGVTYVGANAFRDYDGLISVDFGNAIYELGPNSFRDCDKLSVLQFPASFKVFGESSLQSCDGLKEIHSKGRFPSFRQNSLWETYVTIYYPVDRPWSEKSITDLEAAFKGRITFLASDGTDPYLPTEATTETTTMVTTEVTTMVTTEATAMATTEATAMATTTETVPLSTTIPSQTQSPAQTESVAEEPSTPSSSQPTRDTENRLRLAVAMIALFVAICCLTIIALLILKNKPRKRRKTTRRHR